MTVVRLRKVLIVDDEPDMRFGLRMILENEYAVAEAASGPEGIDLASRETYPVVILDLSMSGMPGIFALQELRKINERQKVIILTGHGSQETAISAVNLGAYKYVLKPVGSKLMKALVKEAFERYEDDEETYTPRIDNPQVLEKLGLTPREAEVAYWAMYGDTNLEIAQRLGISSRTVEKHLEAIQGTLGINRRHKLAIRVLELSRRLR